MSHSLSNPDAGFAMPRLPVLTFSLAVAVIVTSVTGAAVLYRLNTLPMFDPDSAYPPVAAVAAPPLRPGRLVTLDPPPAGEATAAGFYRPAVSARMKAEVVDSAAVDALDRTSTTDGAAPLDAMVAGDEPDPVEPPSTQTAPLTDPPRDATAPSPVPGDDVHDDDDGGPPA